MKKLYCLQIFLLFSFSYIYANYDSFAVESIELPDLGSSQINIAEEIKIGQSALRYIYGRESIYLDTEVYTYIKEVTNYLNSYAHIDYPITTIVIDNPQINAFAIPGGIIGIHTGLISNSSNEDELISVIAHELAHLKQKHFFRFSSETQQVGITSIVAALIGIGIGIPVAPALGGAIAYSSEQRLSYSREHELEADSVGYEIMLNAGFDPKGSVSLLRKLRSYPSHLEYLSTHPVTSNRIVAIENRINNFNISNESINNRQISIGRSDFSYTKIKVNFSSLSDVDVKENIENISKAKGVAIQKEHEDLVDYKLAWLYLLDDNPKEALIYAQRLYKKNPEGSFISYLYAKSLVEHSKVSDLDADLLNQAQNVIDRYLRLNPGNFSHHILYAEIEYLKGDISSALSQLNKINSDNQNNIIYWDYIYRYTLLLNSPFDRHLVYSRVLNLLGNFDKAIMQISLAQEYVEGDLFKQSRLNKELRFLNSVVGNSN